MKKEILDWLKNIEKIDGIPPKEVIAYNFGLFESDQGYMMYIVGAFEYDDDDDDWACVGPPPHGKTHRYLNFSQEFNSKPWEQIENYSKKVLTELEKSGDLNNTFLKNAIAITTGFDDGDLIKIRKPKRLKG